MSALTGIQKILIVSVLVVLLGAGYFFYQTGASTFLGITLTTNPDLERGLVLHYTFDDTDLYGSVRPRNSMGEDAIMINYDTNDADLLQAQQATLASLTTISSISMYVGNAAGKLRLGIYDATGPSGGPGALVASTTELTPVPGWNTANVVTPVALSAGTYWIAFLPSSNALTIRMSDSGSGALRNYAYTYGNLPTTFSLSPSSYTVHFSLYASDGQGQTFSLNGVSNHASSSNPGFIVGGVPTVGPVGQAITFDGVDDYILIDDSANFDIGAGNATVAAWFKPSNNNSSFHGIASHTDGLTATDGWWFTIDMFGAGDGLIFSMSDTDHLGNTELDATEGWVHVIAVKNGSVVTLYKNGISLATVDNAKSITNSAGKFRIGMEGSTHGNSFCNCSIDDFRFYNRALSANEVKRLYGLGATTKIAETITTNPNLERGLVGHWTFDGNDVDWSSTTAEVRDISGNNNHGNATTSSMRGSTTPGTLGQAVRFDGGVGGVVQIPYSSNMQPTSEVSYGGWFNFNATTGSRHLINQQAGATPFTGWILEIFNGRIGGTIDTATTWNFASTSVSFVNLGEWYHLFVTYSSASSETRFYVNGERVVTDTTPNGNLVYNGNLVTCLGSDRFATTTCGNRYYFDGKMDDVRVYSRELSADEVKRLYQLGGTTHVAETITTNPNLERGLVGHWTFDGQDVDWSSTTAEVRDRSGNNNHGSTTVTTSTSTAPTRGVLGQAIRLDGVDDYAGVLDSASLDITGDITATGWVYLDGQPPGSGATKNPRLVQKGQAVGGGVGNKYAYQLEIDSSSGTNAQPAFFVAIGNTDYGVTASQSISLNAWHHVVGVRSGTDLYLYIDGARASTTSGVAGSIDNEGDLYIGESPQNSDGLLDGSLDDVRIYNRALSAAEVKRLYDLGQ